MVDQTPTLHLLCGKIAAGKSTLAKRLADAPNTVLIAEDFWLSRLYPGGVVAVADYVRCAARLRDAMGDHIEAVLRAGVSVVLDFPANTVANRRWMREIFEAASVDHRLHYLDLPEAVCRERLRQRNAEGVHDFAASEADFEVITRYFVAPAPDEGFDVTVYKETDQE